MWKTEFDQIQVIIKRKIDFLNKREKDIDLSKPDKYNQAILTRLNNERQFINELLAFLINTEKYIKLLEGSNKHLTTQNTVYFHLANTFEAEIEKDYERELRAIIQK